MKRLIQCLTFAVLLPVLFGGLVAVAENHEEVATLRVVTAQDNDTYLVDSDGTLVYIFKPSGTEVVPLSETWWGPSRTWGEHWEPILVEGPDALVVGDGVNPDDFEVIEKVRNGVTTYHVYWGGERTDGVAFWGLYSYRYDQPLEHYSMRLGGTPPGSIPSIWQPALVSGQGAPRPARESRLDDPPGGPSGDTYSGGP
jgi:hypothetical protein